MNAIVDHYSSHGAYVRIDAVVGYVPLRLMADPPPRSAREFMKVGESVTLVVDSFRPAKRSIDLAIPGLGAAATPVEETKATPAKQAKKAVAKKAAKPATKQPAPARKKAAPAKAAPVKAAPVKKTTAKPAVKATATKVPAKPTAAKAPAKKSAGALTKLGLRRRRTPE